MNHEGPENRQRKTSWSKQDLTKIFRKAINEAIHNKQPFNPKIEACLESIPEGFFSQRKGSLELYKVLVKVKQELIPVIGVNTASEIYNEVVNLLTKESEGES